MGITHPIPTKRQFEDLTGTRNHHVLLVRYDGYIGKDRAYIADCDCGNRFRCIGSMVARGKRRYCGHDCRLYRSEKSQMNSKHGMHKTPEWKAWRSMRERCLNKNCKKYPRYGGRGFRPCKGFMEFADFFAVLGNRPSKDHSLDRIETKRGYHCGRCAECRRRGWKLNCRWATPTEQNRNRSNNHWLTHNGERRCITEWAKLVGLTTVSISQRLQRGWTVGDALTIPRGRRRNGIYY